jgi:hypothetical protein
MFTVTEAQAAAIRAAFDRGGELSAAADTMPPNLVSRSAPRVGYCLAHSMVR